MSGLKPLLRTQLSAIERRLLMSGISDQPDVALQLRMARALGVSPLVVYVAAIRRPLSVFALRAACGLNALGNALLAGSD